MQLRRLMGLNFFIEEASGSFGIRERSPNSLPGIP
jgi:hypothetical protein